MRSAKKIWLIVAAALVVLGLLTWAVVMSIFGWNFSKLDTAKYETNEYTVTEDFNDISIDTKTANIEFLLSDDDSCRVVCHEMVKAKHTVSVESGTLNIKLNDQRKWYNFLNIGFGSPKVTVYLPAGVYGALQINASTGDINISGEFGFKSIDISVSTGDIRVENLHCGSVVIAATTGKIDLSNLQIEGDLTVGVSTGDAVISSVVCNNFKSKGSTGNITLNSLIARGGMSVSRSTGDVKLNGCDASEIYITTATGSVKGSLLSEKVFIAKTNTGKVDVPKTISGGRCEITTSTGDIIITVG